MTRERQVGFKEDVREERSRPPNPLLTRRRSVAVPGSFIMPRTVTRPTPKPDDDVEHENGIKLKLPLLKTRAEWRALQEREEREERGENTGEKRQVTEPTGFKHEENVDASVHLQEILDNLVPKMCQKSDDNLQRAKDFTVKLMDSLSQDPAVMMFFRQKQFKGERLYNLCQTAPESFELRVYIRAFLFREEFQVLTGFNSGIPQGKVVYALSPVLTTQQRHTVKQTWSQIIHKDWLQSNVLTVLLNEALHHLFAHEDLEIATHSIDNNGHLTVHLLGQPVTIRMMASIPGQGLPRSLKLTHALPKHLPYCLEGKNLLAKICQEIELGHVMWHADAGVERYWTLSFQPLLKRLARNAESVPRAMSYRDCKNVFHILQTCNPCLRQVTPTLLEHNLITVWKRPFQPTQDIFEETIVLLLRKLSLCLRMNKCPHLFFPNLNIVDCQLDDVQQAADLLEKIAKVLWIRPDKISDYTVINES